MYHYPHQPLHVQTDYQHYGAFDHEKTFVTINQAPTQFDRNVQQSLNPVQAEVSTEVSAKPDDQRKVSLKKSDKKTPVDTSSFSIEERLVAAVWVHERKSTKSSISQIKQEFRQRFGREPPAKNTLLVWERKLFSMGSVHDAPRPGRPVKRSGIAAAVLASVQGAPALSMRARARALRLPRTTLRTVLLRDLRHLRPDHPHHGLTTREPTSKQRTKKATQSAKKQHSQLVPAEPTASLPYPQGYT